MTVTIVLAVSLPIVAVSIVIILFEFTYIKDYLDAINCWIDRQSYIKSGKEYTIDGVQYEELIRVNDEVKSFWPKRGEKL